MTNRERLDHATRALPSNVVEFVYNFVLGYVSSAVSVPEWNRAIEAAFRQARSLGLIGEERSPPESSGAGPESQSSVAEQDVQLSKKAKPRSG